MNNTELLNKIAKFIKNSMETEEMSVDHDEVVLNTVMTKYSVYENKNLVHIHAFSNITHDDMYTIPCTEFDKTCKVLQLLDPNFTK